jgi:hypothetical protein
VRNPDLSGFRRAMQLRDRCCTAAVTAGLRLKIPMSPVQANVAFDSMVDLIREHDEAGAGRPDSVTEWSDIAYEMWAVLCNSTTNGHSTVEDWNAARDRLRDRFHAALATLPSTVTHPNPSAGDA